MASLQPAVHFRLLRMENLLLSMFMHPKLWRALGLCVWGSGGVIGGLAWRLGKVEARTERRLNRFNIDIEASIANALPDWLLALLPQSTLGWCMWAVWMIFGFYSLHVSKVLARYY